MRNPIQQLLSPADLIRLRNLNISSRFTVEGSLQGAHRSPHRGFSVEFADYRQYVTGDDMRHLDWKVYARNERLYVRQYEEECNLRVYLLVDGSRSMAFSGDQRRSKYHFAIRLAAALAYVTIQQHDSAGLTLFDRDTVCELPARQGRRHLRMIGERLLDHTPRHPTGLARTLHRLAEQVQRRAVIAIVSDLFDDLDSVGKALAHFRRCHHDVIIYQVLDPAELSFPFTGAVTFQDLETGVNLMAEPNEIRRAYQQEISQFLGQCKAVCAGLDLDYSVVDSQSSPVEALRRHLARRTNR